MRNPRIYQPLSLSVGETLPLNTDAFGHVVRVLRLNTGDNITLFCNDGYDYQAELVDVTKKHAAVKILSAEENTAESPLNIHLGQGISRGDRMDFTLQKSVELGVTQITPLFTERCGVKLNRERLEKKQEQWQKIVISACEQSGRSQVPTVHFPESFDNWIKQPSQELKLNLHPRAQHSIMSLPVNDEYQQQNIRLLIGPEGGLTDTEITQALSEDFHEVLLGPRVLRTETAALTAITALQCRFGDLT